MSDQIIRNSLLITDAVNLAIVVARTAVCWQLGPSYTFCWTIMWIRWISAVLGGFVYKIREEWMDALFSGTILVWWVAGARDFIANNTSPHSYDDLYVLTIAVVYLVLIHQSCQDFIDKVMWWRRPPVVVATASAAAANALI